MGARRWSKTSISANARDQICQAAKVGSLSSSTNILFAVPTRRLLIHYLLVAHSQTTSHHTTSAVPRAYHRWISDTRSDPCGSLEGAMALLLGYVWSGNSRKGLEMLKSFVRFGKHSISRLHFLSVLLVCFLVVHAVAHFVRHGFVVFYSVMANLQCRFLQRTSLRDQRNRDRCCTAR